MNIPIYRAKNKNNDEYIQGYLLSKNIIVTIEYYYPQGMPSETEEKFNNIDPTTLAIHFPNMLDSQENKIFASLSEDGKGGDIICDGDGYKVNFIFYKNSFQFRYIFNRKIGAKFIPSKIKVIGIQE